MNLAEIFERLALQAATHGRKTALLVPRSDRVSYSELWERIQQVASGLRADGLQPGDRVLFAVRPKPEAIVLILAIVRAGGVVVTLDLGANAEVFARRMELVQPRWVVAESTVFALGSNTPLRGVLRRRGMEVPRLSRLEGCRLVRVGRWIPGSPREGRPSRLLTYRALLGSPMGPLPPIDDEDAPLLMVFTSGTTAAPRVVVHSGRSIAATVSMAAEHLGLKENDRVYSGELHMILPGLLAGATCILPRGGRFSAKRLLSELKRYRVTQQSGVPTDYQQVIEVLDAGEQGLPGTLRSVLLGSAPVPAAFLERLKPHVAPGTEVWSVYGATEMLPLCRVSLLDKTAYAGEGDLVGDPFPGVTIRLDESGELCASGPNLCHGYLGEPPLTEFRSGDIARLDAQGRVVLLGRAKDMIIRGHQNIYPELIEPVIARIAGVRRCALLGIPSADGADERVILAVEPEPGTDRRALLKRVANEVRSGPRRIDPAARPDRVVVMTLPLAGRSLKIDKAEAARRINERLA